MFVFAILFFGIMTDAGMLDPSSIGSCAPSARVRRGSSSGTALLALLVHLDGSGAVTFLVTVPAMLPLYERLGMDRRDPRVRGVAGRGRELPAVDRADAARRGRAPHPDHRALSSAVPVQIVGLVFVVRARLVARDAARSAGCVDRAGGASGRDVAAPLTQSDACAAPPRPVLDQRRCSPSRDR